MTKKGTYPNKLRTLLKEAGLTIRELHRETQIPESTLHYWAAGNGVIPKEDRHTLAKVIGCSAFDLAPQHAMLSVETENNVSALEKEFIMKRRELLHILSGAGTALFLSEIDWDHIDFSLTKPSSLDMAMVSDLEAINSHYWNLFLAASPKVMILDGALGQLKLYLQFLKEPQIKQVHQRLCTLASSMSQLAGEICFDVDDHETARSCYTFAVLAAKEVRAYDLWASALVRHSYLPLFDERYTEALLFLKQAEYIAQQGDSHLSTRQWAAATVAEAEAGVGNLHACQQALARAETIQYLTQPHPAWIRFDRSRLPALHGACYVRLHQPQHAEPVLQKALQDSTKTNRRRALILSDLALSALQEHDVEKACTYANEFITITSKNASGFLRKGVLKVDQYLTPFQDSEAVRLLKKRMVLLK